MALYRSSNRLLYQIVYFVSAIIAILLLSGITYGWASILVVFKEKGFFQDLCQSVKNSANASSLADNSTILRTHSRYYQPAGCSAQSKMFNLVFNVSVAFLCGFKLPIGVFIDKYGPRAGQILGGLVPNTVFTFLKWRVQMKSNMV